MLTRGQIARAKGEQFQGVAHIASEHPSGGKGGGSGYYKLLSGVENIFRRAWN